MSNFDKNGVYISKELKKGDVFIYTDSRTKMMQTVRVVLTGIWDDEKVSFGDNQKTVVRNPTWLTKLEKKGGEE